MFYTTFIAVVLLDIELGDCAEMSERAVRFLPGAVAVVVAWAIPTTATVNSC